MEQVIAPHDGYGSMSAHATAVGQCADSGHTDMVHDTQFDYYGQLLATASSDRTIAIHIAKAGAPLQRIATLAGHDGPVWMISWAHPRFGCLLASASYDKRAIVWKEVPHASRTWMPVHVVDVHQGSVNAVTWAAHEYGPVLATASSDGVVAVTAYHAGFWQPSVKVSNNSNQITHAMGATSVSFAPYKPCLADKLLLASGGCDCHVRLWVAGRHENGQLQPFVLHKLLDGHTDWVRDVAFCPISSASRFLLLASCGQDKRVVLYRVPWEQLGGDVHGTGGGGGSNNNVVTHTGTWEQSVMTFDDAVWRLSWAPSSELLLVTTADASVYVLREGADFAEPWIKTPLAEYVANS